MYSYTQLHDFLANGFHPLITVESTSAAERTCKEAGVTTLELLKSFAVEKDINYSLTFESRSVPMKSVSFDLEYSSRLQPASDDAIEKELEETLEREEPSKQQLHALAQSLGDASVDVDGNQPWILPLVSTLLKGCRFGEADLVNHPLAVILIVSSTDTDPLHRFDELSQRVLQRPVFRNGSYSKSIPFFYFLIHTSESSSIAEGVFRTMKSTFNASQCKMLRINSLSKEEQRSVTPSSLSSVPQGTCLRLSDEDIRGIASSRISPR